MRKLFYRFKENSSIIVIIFLILLVIFLFLFNRIVITINSGESGVLYRLFHGGTDVAHVYSEGIHFIWPWDKMYIYNLRVQESHNFDVLTKTGLKIDLRISIRYFPDDKMVGTLHKTVGPEYVKIVVIPQIENVLRILIGQLDLEDVYMTKQGIIEKAINEAVEQISRRYINVDAVIIKNIGMPASIEKAIQDKIEQKQASAAYEYKLVKEQQELERKNIEAEGLKVFNKSLSREVLYWMGIQAALKLAESPNSKVVVIGTKEGGFQIFGDIPLDFPNASKNSGGSDSSNKKGLSELPPDVKASEKKATEKTSGTEKKTAPGTEKKAAPEADAASPAIPPQPLENKSPSQAGQ